MNTIKNTLIREHWRAVNDGKFDVAWLILKFLRTKEMSLGLGDVAYETERILEHAGCQSHYSRNYDIVRFDLT